MNRSETMMYVGGSNGKIYVIDICGRVINKFLLNYYF